MAGTKSRKFTKVERVIFQAGVSEGLSRGQAATKKLKHEHKQAIAKYKKANVALWEEIHRLDTNNPLVGVLIPLKLANYILAALLKYNPSGKYSKGSFSSILKSCIEKSEQRNLGPSADHLTEIADDSLCERPEE